MQRLATLLVAALMLVSISGLAFAEEAKPAEQKDGAAVKTEKKVKKTKVAKKGEAAPAKKDEAAGAKKDEAPVKTTKPGKKKKEVAGC
jgi:uncharacterized lipoprotein YehR (DUF1307 family)